jgi:4-amino-4-deoxy-L-arabinose transferase-like glycosyltransferase
VRAVQRARAAGWLWALLLALLLARLVAMAWLPLMDTTEARYGEIARKMAELGDWVTPWHDYGVPFWGKPPLSFWLTAASLQVMGVSEFAARLPHLLCALAMAWLVWDFARRWRGARVAALCLGLLAGSLLFIVAAGAVMTDGALVLATTWAMCSFWLALHGQTAAQRRRHGWLFFVALGLGLLAKGPLALVLLGLPLLPWLLWERRLAEAWRGLPWLLGLLLAAAIALPWYRLAEQRTPGFLNYFIVGEHWHRFVTPGWGGDLYGKAHRYAPGTIWGFALGAMLPWTLLLPAFAWFARRPAAAAGDAGADARALRRYLLLWALTPLLFFSAARNIIWPYALPALPAAALWAGAWMADRGERAEVWVAAGLGLSLLLGLGGGAYGWHSGRIEASTARALVHTYEARHGPGQALIFVGQRPFSAAFYSRGQAQELPDLTALDGHVGPDGVFVALPAALAAELTGTRGGVRLGRFGDAELLLLTPANAVAVKVAAP